MKLYKNSDICRSAASAASAAAAAAAAGAAAAAAAAATIILLIISLCEWEGRVCSSELFRHKSGRIRFELCYVQARMSQTLIQPGSVLN